MMTLFRHVDVVATYTIALLLALNCVALRTTLNISNVGITPDGTFRISTLANRTFPGPLLSAKKDEAFEVNVINSLSNKSYDLVTSIHWHGLFQHTTAWADGVPFVTECPIIPNSSFFYNFTAFGQTGTYWYHSHYAVQYCDGLRGPLVIYDPQDPLAFLYDHDNASTIITLSDWYHLPAHEIPGPPIPDSNLINGLGRTAKNPSAPLAILSVLHSRKYRLRIISMACDPSYLFSIDNHNFTVIEADGEETKPITVDSLRIYASQRYSVVLHADKTPDNYWIRSKPSIGDAGFEGGKNSAILRYVGQPNRDPIRNYPLGPIELHESQLMPLFPVPVPGGNGPADQPFVLNFNFDRNKSQFTINDYAWQNPDMPVLLQILKGKTDPHQLLPSGSIYPIFNRTSDPSQFPSVEIRMNGGVLGGPHPIHLHGHNFHVVRSAGNPKNNTNPVIRDTVNTGNSTDDVTIIRFSADNPGPWFLHCHIDFHIDLGFAAVFAEETEEIKSKVPVPPEWDKLCPAYYNWTKANEGVLLPGHPYEGAP